MISNNPQLWHQDQGYFSKADISKTINFIDKSYNRMLIGKPSTLSAPSPPPTQISRAILMNTEQHRSLTQPKCPNADNSFTLTASVMYTDVWFLDDSRASC